MDRRRFLALGAGAVVAGCLGADGTGSDDGGDSGEGEGDTLETHPASRTLAAQPRLGPDPAEATGVIVVFEDPSCPTCRRFEQTVVPQIRRELVEPGDASLVFRGYPVVYDWGEPAVRALEATDDADPEAHWTLASHYFDRQREFRASGPDAVYDRTETFLAENTALDATAVVDAARNGDYDDAVQADLDAGMAAGAGNRTPHVFLFRDGAYQTKFAGSVSYEAISSVIQV